MHEYILDFVFKNFLPPEMKNIEGLRKNAMILIQAVDGISSFEQDRELMAKYLEGKLDFYGGSLKQIFTQYSIPQNAIGIESEIQLNAALYLVIYLTKNRALEINNLKSRLKEISETSQKLQALLSPDATNGIIIAALLGEDFKALYEAQRNEKKLPAGNALIEQTLVDRIIKQQKALDLLVNIEDTFRTSKVAEWLQFGRSGRKENLALKLWVRQIAEIWVQGLGRSLSYTKELKSGREQFLQFAESCFQYVHSDLEADTVRNAFEDLRSNGKLDYLYPIVE